MTVAKYNELTIRAVLLGVFQGVILNLAFLYSALKLGFSIGGSEVAAIMGFAILRGLFRNGTSLENNINQSVASSINTAGTGVVFTFPALYLIDAKLKSEGQPGINFTLLPFILCAVAGTFLGNVLIIPLRKQMIELDRLRFPSGVATSAIIRSSSSGFGKAKLLILGTVIAAIWKMVLLAGWLDSPGLIEHEELNFSFNLIPAYFMPMISLSIMNIAAGMLAGGSGLPLLWGGLLAWWLIAPVAIFAGWAIADTPVNQTWFIYGKMLRPLGIGVLIGGALMSVVLTFPAIRAAFSALKTAAKTAKANKGEGGSAFGTDEMSFRSLAIGAFGALALFFIAAILVPGVTVSQAVLGSVIGTIWLGVAGLIVAQSTGMTNISPLSGMALISVTLMMFIFKQNVAAAMIVGVAVCVAIGQAADMMQDLKTGFMLGARPIRQQVAQFSVAWIGAVLGVVGVAILWSNGPGGSGGFGPGTSLPAPQAGVLTGIIQALQSGQVPVDKYVLGAILGALLSLAPVAGLGVLIGLSIYLPLSITLGYGLGCIATFWLVRKKGKGFYEEKIVPLAAGLIVGEALLGIGHAAMQIISGK